MDTLSLTTSEVYHLQAATINYTYDPLNRLIREEYDNGTTIDYTYDAVGNRLSRVIVSPITIVNAELSGATQPETIISDPTPVPDGPAGTLSFTAAFCNVGHKQLTELKSVTTVLTGGNVLLNRDPETPPGVGSELTFAANGGFVDRILAPGECVEVPYQIGLAEHKPFDFFVDVLGVITPSEEIASVKPRITRPVSR